MPKVPNPPKSKADKNYGILPVVSFWAERSILVGVFHLRLAFIYF
jgi:hypothetical protein